MQITDLHAYQKRAVAHLLKNTHAALFMDMGLGKTIAALTAIDILMFKELDISHPLIVAPKRVVESVWSQEAAIWEHTKHLTFSKIVGSEKQRLTALNKKADIHLISRDNIRWLCDKFETLPFDMLVIDELSSFKNASSRKFKLLRKKQPDFDRVVGLTGTPAPNSLMDLWSQLFLLDRGERLGRTITNYRQQFFYQIPRHYGHTIRKYSEDIIHHLIKDICISMEAKDYLELPKRKDNIINIEFPPDLAKQYEAFAREAVMELASKEVTAVNASVLTNKLLQFANGAIYDQDKVVHSIHDLKMDAAQEIVRGANGKPVLIAWTYKFDRDKLLAKFPQARELKTDQDIIDWNAGEIEILLMHPASGGHGLNLQKGGNIIIWFGQTWSLELYQQLNARLDRQGLTKAVIVHHLVIKGTMDEQVIKRLESKDKGQKALMEATKAMIRKYGT